MFRAHIGRCALHATDPADPCVRVTVTVQSILMLLPDIIRKRLGEDQRFPDRDAAETEALRTVPAE